MKQSHWPISILAGISSLVNLVLPMVMSRILPADEIGSFKIFFLFLMTTPALALSIGVVNGLFFWGGRGDQGHKSIQTAWTILLLCALIAPIAFLLSFPLLPFNADWSHAQLPLFLLATPPAILSSFYEFTAIAKGRLWKSAIFSSGFEMLRTGTILATVLFTRSVILVFLVHSAVSWLKVLTGYVLSRQDGFLERGLTLGARKEVLRYALPVSFSGIFDLLLNNSDRYILSSLIPASDYAVYTFGCLALPPLLIFEQSVNKVLIPKLSHCLAAREMEQSLELYRAASEELLMILIPAVAGLIVFAQPIITLLFTDRYLAAAGFLRLFAMSYILLGVPHDVFARALGDGHWIFRNCVIFGILSLGLAGILAWAFGPYGALSAMLISVTLQKAYGLLYIRNRLETPLTKLFPLSRIGGFILVAAFLSGGSLALRAQFGRDLTWFLTCGPVFAALYLSIILPLRRKIPLRA